MQLWIDIAGWVGSLEVIIAYFLISQKKLESTSVAYQTLNLTGAMLLIVNTVYYTAYPSTFINVIWVGIAIHALWSRKQD